LNARATRATSSPPSSLEFLDAERLRQVVVCAVPEARELVLFVAAGRQDQDRCVPIPPLVPDRAAQRQSVSARQHHVQHDDIERPSAHDLQRLASVRNRDALVPVGLDLRADQLPDVRLVFDDEQLPWCRLAPADAHDMPLQIMDTFGAPGGAIAWIVGAVTIF
jgi:hypothetical protein